jgi:hypothetical protein
MIVAAGYTSNGTNIDFALARYEGVLRGDYDLSGGVGAADYVLWRKTLGTSVAAYSGADGDGDGVVDQDDYGIWRANFGNTSPASASALGVAAAWADGAGQEEDSSISAGFVTENTAQADSGESAIGPANSMRPTDSRGGSSRLVRQNAVAHALLCDRALVAWLAAKTKGTTHETLTADIARVRSELEYDDASGKLGSYCSEGIDLALAGLGQKT